ncbi:MAG: helix-turn-helix domain-containing protein [Planctomycetia bacterium]|nr:helix-turn-helix domain-containing protein [Planctomycetia bacterium]
MIMHKRHNPSGNAGNSHVGSRDRYPTAVRCSATTPTALDEECVMTIDDLHEMFNVSTKTISRWREQGLAGQQFIIAGRKRIGFRRSSVDTFARQDRERIRRATRFSQLTPQQCDEIIALARHLVSQGDSQTHLINRLAAQTGRSVETIRYTIKRFEEQHTDGPIFLNSDGARTVETRAKHLLELPLDDMHSAEFDARTLPNASSLPCPSLNILLASRSDPVACPLILRRCTRFRC